MPLPGYGYTDISCHGRWQTARMVFFHVGVFAAIFVFLSSPLHRNDRIVYYQFTFLTLGFHMHLLASPLHRYLLARFLPVYIVSLASPHLIPLHLIFNLPCRHRVYHTHGHKPGRANLLLIPPAHTYTHAAIDTSCTTHCPPPLPLTTYVRRGTYRYWYSRISLQCNFVVRQSRTLARAGYICWSGGRAMYVDILVG